MFRLAGSTLGLIGFGNIARRVARGAASLDMRVLYSDPFVEAGQFDVPGEKVEFEDLLKESDYLCVHAPLTPQTRGMVGADAFSKMKSTAFIINCSRGPIIDTEALVQALDGEQIAGCALDTTDPEPLPTDHSLRSRENVIINPHAAWYSEQAMGGLQRGAPSEVRRVLEGKWPINVVNQAVKENNRAGI
jgi:D-3-phosphoglycerate dehydrogenase